MGIVRIDDALRLARESELDLVEVAPMARPPVAKLMDYGKFKYENAQKARESRRNQTNTVIKEMKLRPKIDSHDYETKKGHVVRFLKAGDKVKITIMFRGREQSRPELGYNLLRKLAEDVNEFGFVESAPKQDGRNMLMVLGPMKKKTEARADVRAERDRRAAERRRRRRGGAEPAGRPAGRSTPPSRRSAAPWSGRQPGSRRRGLRSRDRTNDLGHRAHDDREKGAAAMPKMKTHSGAKKRFKVTGSGKLMHRKAGKMHLNEHKPSTRTRRLAGDKVLSSGDAAKARKLLGL